MRKQKGRIRAVLLRAEIDSFHGNSSTSQCLWQGAGTEDSRILLRALRKIARLHFPAKIRQNAARVRWHWAGSPAVQRAGPFSAGPCFRGLGVDFAPRSLCKKGGRGPHRARPLSRRGFGPARGLASRAPRRSSAACLAFPAGSPAPDAKRHPFAASTFGARRGAARRC